MLHVDRQVNEPIQVGVGNVHSFESESVGVCDGEKLANGHVGCDRCVQSMGIEVDLRRLKISTHATPGFLEKLCPGCVERFASKTPSEGQDVHIVLTRDVFTSSMLDLSVEFVVDSLAPGLEFRGILERLRDSRVDGTFGVAVRLRTEWRDMGGEKRGNDPLLSRANISLTTVFFGLTGYEIKQRRNAWERFGLVRLEVAQTHDEHASVVGLQHAT